MVVGHITGVGDFISCNVYQFLSSPSVAVFYTFLMILVDKMITIVYPYHYRKMMTPCVVAYTITALWVLTVDFASPKLLNPGDYTKVAEYGVCLSHGGSFVGTLLSYTLPMITSSLLAVIIDVCMFGHQSI